MQADVPDGMYLKILTELAWQGDHYPVLLESLLDSLVFTEKSCYGQCQYNISLFAI